MKGDLSREVVLLSNELDTMRYKRLTAAGWKAGVAGTRDPTPAATCSQLLGCLEAVWPSVPPAHTSLRLGGQELALPRLRETKQRIQGIKGLSQIRLW